MYDLAYERQLTLQESCHLAIVRNMQQWDWGQDRWMPTPKQIEVIRHLANGLRHKQISDRMGVHDKTVSSHLEDIRKKSKTKTMVQAVLYCQRLGII